METIKDMKKAYQTTTIINSAIMASLVIYVVVVEIMKARFEPFEGLIDNFDFIPLRYALYALAMANLIVIVQIRKVLLKKASFDDSRDAIERLRRTSIITSAFCEIPAIMGLILFLLSGLRRDFYLLLVLSFIFVFLFFPRYSNWEEWVRSNFKSG